MNRLEEIQELIKKFIYEKQQMRQEINAIEEKRNVLAQERNNKINENKGKAYTEEVQARIFELGNQIKELGNQSQELQNKLDKKYFNIKSEITTEINENISSIMPGIQEIEGERVKIQQQIEEKENRDARYIKQKEEFYKRFGRIPVLSENAMKENELQEEEYRKNKSLIEQLDNEIKTQEEEVSKLVKIANDFKKGNWQEYIQNNQEQEDISNTYKQEMIESYTKKIVEEVINPIVEEIIDSKVEIEKQQDIISENKESLEEDSIILPFTDEVQDSLAQEEKQPIQEVKVEGTEPIEEVKVEEIETLPEVKIEEVEPIEEIKVEEIETLPEVKVEEEKTLEEIEPIEEISVEEIKPIEEINIEEIKVEDFSDQEIEPQEEKSLEELLAREEEKTQQEIIENIQKVEENINIDNNEKNQENINEEVQDTKNEEDIIAYESQQEESEKVGTYFGEKVNLLNINAKFEDGEVVYKAQTSNGDCIKVYPRKSQAGNILLKDKENREELKEILINYAIAEYRMFDKKVMKKIDPSVCETLIRFAKKYNYDAQSLIYNYAMSFSKNDEIEIDNIPTITYNFAYLQETNLDKKERDVLAKICKNARKNSRIDIIGYNTGIKKIKYMLKRTFSVNDANALPEGKY